MERFNQKTVFEVKTVRQSALGPGIKVEFVAALAAREIDEPSQHFTAETAAARRLARDQVIDVEESAPREAFEDAETGAADALTFVLEIRKAISGLLLSLDASQECLRGEVRAKLDEGREAGRDLRVGFS